MCFFFKQKTAYEMRISDWSSDVCSSDLAEGGVSKDEVFRSTPPERRFLTASDAPAPKLRKNAGETPALRAPHRTGPQTKTAGLSPGEIGRASGRERVWPSV